MGKDTEARAATRFVPARTNFKATQNPSVLAVYRGVFPLEYCLDEEESCTRFQLRLRFLVIVSIPQIYDKTVTSI